jgi:hypothetical protein
MSMIFLIFPKFFLKRLLIMGISDMTSPVYDNGKAEMGYRGLFGSHFRIGTDVFRRWHGAA